ncbi:hypothetical protein [Desulfothermobacter acidiphilus]|uniref:hypothetical protein n=1 Tax=Desulfothermobacter acidiphilus TaxID=1938353 RepID=UPI003F8C3AB0
MKKIWPLLFTLIALSLSCFDWSWWYTSRLCEPSAISGSVSAHVVVNDIAEGTTQGLQLLAPNLYGADAYVSKSVDGVTASASSSVRVYLPNATTP